MRTSQGLRGHRSLLTWKGPKGSVGVVAKLASCELPTGVALKRATTEVEEELQKQHSRARRERRTSSSSLVELSFQRQDGSVWWVCKEFYISACTLTCACGDVTHPAVSGSAVQQKDGSIATLYYLVCKPDAQSASHLTDGKHAQGLVLGHLTASPSSYKHSPSPWSSPEAMSHTSIVGRWFCTVRIRVFRKQILDRSNAEEHRLYGDTSPVPVMRPELHTIPCITSMYTLCMIS